MMAKKEDKALEVPKQEVITKEDMERTRERRCFIPKTDIYETDQEIILVADIPGADHILRFGVVWLVQAAFPLRVRKPRLVYLRLIV